jgi:predicted  nucleic acid-binding Zn-ribbon protein
MELKAREAREFAMKYKVELEGAGKNVQEVSRERDSLMAQNTKLNEKLEECRRTIDKKESAFSFFFGFWGPKQEKMINTLEFNLRQATQELDQKKAQNEKLQDSCNQMEAKWRETETRLKQVTAELNQVVQAQNNPVQKLQQNELEKLKSEVCAMLEHIMPDMVECLAIARELEA